MEKRKRPQVLTGLTYQIKTGCGDAYITINEDDKGMFEVFLTMGKAGGCASSQIEAIGRCVSLGLRCGIPPEEFIRQLSGISCHYSSVTADKTIPSCANAVAIVMKEHLDDKNAGQL